MAAQTIPPMPRVRPTVHRNAGQQPYIPSWARQQRPQATPASQPPRLPITQRVNNVIKNAVIIILLMVIMGGVADLARAAAKIADLKAELKISQMQHPATATTHRR